MKSPSSEEQSSDTNVGLTLNWSDCSNWKCVELWLVELCDSSIEGSYNEDSISTNDVCVMLSLLTTSSYACSLFSCSA